MFHPEVSNFQGTEVIQTKPRSSKPTKMAEKGMDVVLKSCPTVFWEEIRRSPVEGQVVYPNIYKVLAPSQGVQDFFHQQQY